MRILTAYLNRRFLRLLPIVLIITLILSVIGPNSASADPGWYNLSWQHRKKITIHAANVSATQSNFPLLINLASDTELAADAQDDGDDILFTASDEVTQLSHEIEYFNGTTGQLVAWVKIPSLSSVTDTEIYMYYGNAGAANQEDVTNVWDINYKMVQHLEETSGGVGAITDSTVNNNDGSDQNSPALGASGKIDGATGFTGSSNHYINCGNAGSLNITGDITVEAWIYVSSSQTNRGIVAKAQTGNMQYWLYMDGGGNITFSVHDGFLGPYNAVGGTPTLNAWNHIVGVYDGANVKVYVNNTQTIGAAFNGAILSTPSNVTIANFGGLGSSTAFTGTIDEVRISSYARTPDWITTSFRNQVNPGSFYTLGPEQNPTVLPTVTTSNATAVQETIATLNGHLDNDGGEACQYAFEWGTNPGVYTNNISWTGSVVSGQDFSTNLIGLIKGQPYYYRAMVKNSAGVAYGGEKHFLTKPDGPTLLTATANSSSRIDLTWTKGTGAQRTIIVRKTGTYPTSYTDGMQVYFNTGTSFSDTTLTANTTFYYRAWSEVTGSQQFSNTFASANAKTFAAPPVSASTIGGKVYSVNKAAILLPWIIGGLVSLIILVNVLLYIRKKRKSRPPPDSTASLKPKPPA